jgi:hypothetical protein
VRLECSEWTGVTNGLPILISAFLYLIRAQIDLILAQLSGVRAFFPKKFKHFRQPATSGKIFASTLRVLAPPSLREHYTRFVATTEQPAPLQRIGTFGLAVGAACAFSLRIGLEINT